MKKRLTWIVGGVLALVLVIATVWGVSAYFGSPSRGFLACQGRLLEETLGKWAKNVETRQKDFSSDMTLTARSEEPEINSFLEGTSLELKVQSDKTQSVTNLRLLLMEQQALEMTMIAHADGKIGIYLPRAEEKIYETASVPTLEKLTGQGNKKLTGEEAAALTKLTERVFNLLIHDEAVTRSGSQTVALPLVEDSCKAKVYTYIPRAEDVEQAVYRIADSLETDEALQGLCEKWLGNEEMEIAEAVASLREQAAESGQKVADSGFTWTVAVEGKTVRQIVWQTNTGSLTYEAKVGMAVFSLVQDGAEAVSLTHRWNVAKKEGAISLCQAEMDSQFTLSYALTEELSNLGIPCGTYTFGGNEPGVVTVTVAEEAGGWRHTMEVEADTETAITLELLTTESGTAQMPTAPVENLNGKTDEELEEIRSMLLEAAGNGIVEAVTKAMYGVQ